MVKFNRNYKLTVETQNGELLVIEPPFRIDFDITRNVLTSANICSIRIYNLSQTNRNNIRFNKMDTGLYRSIELKAGYNNNIPVVFTGNITQAWSIREGVNFITSVECFDGGFAFNNGSIFQSFPAGTSVSSIIDAHLNNLPHVTPGVVGAQYTQDAQGNSYTIGRTNSFNGNTIDSLSTLAPNGLFIDNQVANILGDSECLRGEIQIINSSSGLLGTPVREQTILTFDMLFEPRVKAGQLIQLDSLEGTPQTANFNGFYKIVSVKHRVMISAATSGSAITTLGMFYGPSALSVQQ